MPFNKIQIPHYGCCRHILAKLYIVAKENKNRNDLILWGC